MSQPSSQLEADWRTPVFKNRGLLLVPVALVYVIFGWSSPRSAIVGIAVAIVGELLRIWAVGYSGVTTRADHVTAPELVTAGPYKFIRNPLYAGNAIVALGFWLAFSGNVAAPTSVLMFAVAALLAVGIYATIIPLEEAYLAQTFGSAYRRYKEIVPRFFPTMEGLPPEEVRGKWRVDVIVRAEIVTLSYFVLMVAAVILKLRPAG